MFIEDYKNIKTLLKDIGSGVVIVIGIGLLIGSSAMITLEKEKVAKLVALKADFNSSHSCKGQVFENANGVLFLPSGNVLIARVILKNGQIDWSFDESACNKYNKPSKSDALTCAPSWSVTCPKRMELTYEG
ncbi:hypothetical protein ACK3Y4_14190 [Aeromonas caviae]